MDHFQAAQQAIANASAAAAESAKANMVNAYENATRIQMSIRLKAPIIIVPVDSFTDECICLDLGFLSITNTNTEQDVTVGYKIVFMFKICRNNTDFLLIRMREEIMLYWKK